MAVRLTIAVILARWLIFDLNPRQVFWFFPLTLFSDIIPIVDFTSWFFSEDPRKALWLIPCGFSSLWIEPIRLSVLWKRLEMLK